MQDDAKLKNLEQTLAHMRQPVRGIPFLVVVRSLAQRQVIPINRKDSADLELLTRLNNAIALCAVELKANPIRRPRPNEVGMTLKCMSCERCQESGSAARDPRRRLERENLRDTPISLFRIPRSATPTWNARYSRTAHTTRPCGPSIFRPRSPSRCLSMRVTFSSHLGCRPVRFLDPETLCIFPPPINSSTSMICRVM